MDRPTDRYDTTTDSWERLTGADYPDYYGRYKTNAMLDPSTNKIITTGGMAPQNQSDCYVEGTVGDDCLQYVNWALPNKVEIFDLNYHEWGVNEDITDDLYLNNAGMSYGIVEVHDFLPQGYVLKMLRCLNLEAKNFSFPHSTKSVTSIQIVDHVPLFCV